MHLIWPRFRRLKTVFPLGWLDARVLRSECSSWLLGLFAPRPSLWPVWQTAPRPCPQCDHSGEETATKLTGVCRGTGKGTAGDLRVQSGSLLVCWYCASVCLALGKIATDLAPFFLAPGTGEWGPECKRKAVSGGSMVLFSWRGPVLRTVDKACYSCGAVLPSLSSLRCS